MNHPYLPLSPDQRTAMLATIGVNQFTDLIKDIPETVRLARPLQLPDGLSEMELAAEFTMLADQNNRAQLCFLGAGAYQHYIPSVVNHLSKRSEFYTAYTPYQPEISQGMLQAIFEYQSYVAELFGLPVANASLYDGPTALVEAIIMAIRETRRKQVVVLDTLNPLALQVIQTYLRNMDFELVIVPSTNGAVSAATLQAHCNSATAAVVVQSPNFYGIIEDLPELNGVANQCQAVPITYTLPIPLAVLESPGRLGAQIVVAEGQSLGMPLAYGGPYLGMMAASERFIRRIPGRLVGESLDQHGKRSFVLTLQAREQHIRREKATSNICSNQAWCALRAAIYLSALGPCGFRQVAQRCFDNAHYLAGQLEANGFPLRFQQPFFMEFAVQTPKPAAYYLEKLQAKKIIPGLDLQHYSNTGPNTLLICATEIFTQNQLDRLVAEMRDLR